MALANKGFGRIQKKKRKDLREREREIVGEQERKLLFARREERVIDPQEALLLPPPTSKKKELKAKVLVYIRLLTSDSTDVLDAPVSSLLPLLPL